MLVSFVASLQGYLFSLYQGRPQLLWPTFAYSLSIFSVWALLTPPIILLLKRILRSELAISYKALLSICGFAVAVIVHLALFVALFWYIYSSNSLTPFVMAQKVFFANIDTAIFAYVAIFIYSLLSRPNSDIQPPDKDERDKSPKTIKVHSYGETHFLPFNEIDFVKSAGDYVEIHCAGRVFLEHHSLKAFIDKLPDKDFARVHRSTIVNLQRIQKIRSVGRGDALLSLSTGDEIRLSRRYRKALEPS